jgi:hypothetical protein
MMTCPCCARRVNRDVAGCVAANRGLGCELQPDSFRPTYNIQQHMIFYPTAHAEGSATKSIKAPTLSLSP